MAVLFLLLGSASLGSLQEGPPVLSAHFRFEDSAGGRRGLGRAVGAAFRDQFAKVLTDGGGDPELRGLLEYVSTPTGEEILSLLTNATRAAFPEAYGEVEGMAEGSGVPLRVLLVNNFREELCQFAPALVGVPKRPGKCTSAFINEPATGTLLLGHNDDWTQAWQGLAYWVTADRVDAGTNTTTLSFGTWVYPGYLLGMDLSWNSAGLIYSVNSLFPQHFERGGVGTAFVARYLLEATSLEDAFARAAYPGVSTAMSYNLGSTVEKRLVELEVDTGGGTNVGMHAVLPQSSYFHANEFKVMPNASQFPDNSSASRQRRWDAMQPINSMPSVRAFLGDTEGAYPVYRNHTPPDHCFTEVSAVFDLLARRLSVWTTNPRDAEPNKVFMLF